MQPLGKTRSRPWENRGARQYHSDRTHERRGGFGGSSRKTIGSLVVRSDKTCYHIHPTTRCQGISHGDVADPIRFPVELSADLTLPDYGRVARNPPRMMPSAEIVSDKPTCQDKSGTLFSFGLLPVGRRSTRDAQVDDHRDARNACTSRIGGFPKKRLYSRLNWLGLSYPTANAALAASSSSVSIFCRAVRSRSCF
jgi:hypothetical protein